MAARGAKPKAAHLRLIDGTHRTTRHGEEAEAKKAVEAVAQKFGKLSRPKGLKGEGLNAWKRYIEPADWLDGSKEPAAIAFCELWQEFRFAPTSFPASKHGQMRAYKALGNAVLNGFNSILDKIISNLFDQIGTSIASSITGVMNGGGSSSFGTVDGFAKMLFGGAANDNYAPGAVTRSALPNIGSGSTYSVANATDFIRQYASAIGIDPGTALQVARSEGLGAGIWQGSYVKNGFREPSYGPFQLLKGGAGTGFPTGMGNDFMRQTGLDPSNSANWQQSTAFALDQAKSNGWGAWYGAKAQGITGFDGIDRSATKAVGALDKLTTGSKTAVGGIGQLGQAGNQATQGLSAFANNLSKFPAAPSGGGGGFLSSLFGGGGLSSAFSGSAAYSWLSANPGGYIGLYADGTENAPPGWAWVGERGPELMRMRGGETVRSNPRSMDMVANQNSRSALVVNINVVNNAGAQVRTEERQEPDGSLSIDVMVDRIAAEKMTTRGSAANNALRKGFGAQQALKRR